MADPGAGRAGAVATRSSTRHRRAQWKATTPQLVPITVDGVVYRVPQRLAKAYERGLPHPES
ncbi:50S ribosomal protein L32 [Streptomyces sp. NPDC003035]|uniref:50S ribosomal protein L32 n=1 Tax=Streptomyces sp. NPDC003035 TaxID=3364676 RepID=UPI0036A9FF34